MNEFDIYKEALQLCERGELARGQSVADAYFSRAIALLTDLMVRVPGSHRFHQLLGICWYKLSRRDEERSNNLAQHLNAAFTMKPEDQLTLAHLIYFHYEQRRYPQALDLLGDVDYEYFVQAGQPWRNLKYDELRLCCRLRMDADTVGHDEVAALFSAAAALAEADRRPLDDLEACIRDLSMSSGLSAHCTELLEQCALQTAAWNKILPPQWRPERRQVS